MKLWIVRKHPPVPFGHGGFMDAFTIHKAFATRSEAVAEAKARQPRSNYHFTVASVEVKA